MLLRGHRKEVIKTATRPSTPSSRVVKTTGDKPGNMFPYGTDDYEHFQTRRLQYGTQTLGRTRENTFPHRPERTSE